MTVCFKKPAIKNNAVRHSTGIPHSSARQIISTCGISHNRSADDRNHDGGGGFRISLILVPCHSEASRMTEPSTKTFPSTILSNSVFGTHFQIIWVM